MVTSRMTGCAGFIGSQIAADRLGEGDHVRGIDLPSDDYDEARKGSNLAALVDHERFDFLQIDLARGCQEVLDVSTASTARPVSPGCARRGGSGSTTSCRATASRANLCAATADAEARLVARVAGGGECPMQQLIAMVEEIAGRPVELDRQDPQRGDVRCAGTVTDQACDRLGESPEVGLRQGLERQHQGHLFHR